MYILQKDWEACCLYQFVPRSWEPEMTLPKPLLYIPLLHKDMGSGFLPHIADAQYICTGLAQDSNFENPHDNSESFWTPSNYPFNKDEARACLRDIKSMGEAALSGVPLQAFMSMQNPQVALKKTEEQEALRNFTATGQEQIERKEQADVTTVHILQSAQKFLLWAWLMEEYILDLQDLTQKYAANSSNILEALGIENDETLEGIGQIQSSLADSSFVLPPWRLVLENLAPFLPDACTAIITNNDMAEYLLELGTCKTLSEQSLLNLGLTNNSQGHEVVLSVESLLQKNAEQISQAPWLKKELHCIILQNKGN